MADRSHIQDNPEYLSSIERWTRIDAFVSLWQYTAARARLSGHNLNLGMEEFLALPVWSTVEVSQRAISARPDIVQEFTERGVIDLVPGFPNLGIEITYPYPALFANETIDVSPFASELNFDQRQLSEIERWASERPTNKIVLG